MLCHAEKDIKKEQQKRVLKRVLEKERKNKGLI